MINLAIQGICGRMGHALIELIEGRDDCCVVAGIDAMKSDTIKYPVYKSLDEMKEKADVLIDFSHPAATQAALEFCKKNALPCVICTTGLEDVQRGAMKLAAENTAVFFSANMSLGVNLLTQLACRAQAALPGFDIEIVEKHHHNKIDAPSGTALSLADAINNQAGGKYNYIYNRQDVRKKRNPNEIGLHAVRGGSIVGEHDVIFAGPDEVITLSHQAYSRNVFANGAVAAALFLSKKSAGIYSMSDLMAEI